MHATAIVKSAAAILALVAAYPAAAQMPPISEFQQTQTLSEAEAIAGCDQFAGHPLDPMKPANFAGVASDGDINALSAYLYCYAAFQADQDNPRIMFQWGRANHAYNPRMDGQPRQMYRLAYQGGSEIAGVYLARLPPEKSFAELEASMQASIARIRREQADRAASRPMTGAQRDQMLIGSIVTIGTVAMLRILSGEAAPTSECSGGYMIDINTHEMLCNGLVVGTY